MKLGKKYKKILEVYECFKMDNNTELQYGDKELLDMYLYESNGVKSDMTYNGFYWCKHNLDLTIKMWYEDLPKGNITKKELYSDKFPKWWLDKILSKIA